MKDHPYFHINDAIRRAAEETMKDIAPAMARIEEMQNYNQQKMLAAFIEAGVSESHFVSSTGYGYGDRGRDALDQVYASALGAEDAQIFAFAMAAQMLACKVSLGRGLSPDAPRALKKVTVTV